MSMSDISPVYDLAVVLYGDAEGFRNVCDCVRDAQKRLDNWPLSDVEFAFVVDSVRDYWEQMSEG